MSEEVTPELSRPPRKLNPSAPSVAEEEETVLISDDDEPGYTLVEMDEEPDVRLFSAPMVAWIISGLAGLVAPFGSSLLLDLFPGLFEGIIRFDRALLGQVDYALLGVVIAGIFACWAIVFATLIVCVGKRPGFGTGSALAAFLIGPPAILLGLPAVAFLLNQ